MAAEEVKDPRRTIPLGYISGIVTLVVLAFGVMIFAGGAGDWSKLTGDRFAAARSDGDGRRQAERLDAHARRGRPLRPARVVPRDHPVVLAADLRRSRARATCRRRSPRCTRRAARRTWALSRPAASASSRCSRGRRASSSRFRRWARSRCTSAACSRCFGCGGSQPDLERPFRAPLYPVLPLVALALSGLSLARDRVVQPGRDGDLRRGIRARGAVLPRDCGAPRDASRRDCPTASLGAGAAPRPRLRAR